MYNPNTADITEKGQFYMGKGNLRVFMAVVLIQSGLGQEPRFIYLFIFNLLIYLFIFGCVGSSFLWEGFLQLWQAGATLHRSARASHYRGLSCCGAQDPDAQAQQLWLKGLVAPWHVGSSQTRARTRVPCISRQILSHCATREARQGLFLNSAQLLYIQ